MAYKHYFKKSYRIKMNGLWSKHRPINKVYKLLILFQDIPAKGLHPFLLLHQPIYKSKIMARASFFLSNHTARRLVLNRVVSWDEGKFLDFNSLCFYQKKRF